MPEKKEIPQTTEETPEKEPPSPVSRLGSTAKLNGEWVCAEDVVIAGHFQGKIDVGDHDLRIEKNAAVQAEIRGKNITILGKVTGKVTASGKISVGNEAQMIGDLSAPQIAIQDGARFKGSIKMLPKSNPLLA